MASKKIILDFTEQPAVGQGFKYKIYINGTHLSYPAGLTDLNLTYRAGGNSNPYQIGIGSNLDDALNNTLTMLSGQYYFAGTIGGYATTIAYARVANTIEITVTSAAPDDLITFWELVADYNIVFKTDSPCTKVFLSNQSVSDYLTINNLTTNNYLLRNNTLNIDVPYTIPNNYQVILDRGFNYSVVRTINNSIKSTFDIPASVDISNVFLYFSNNDLFININGASPILYFRYSLDGVNYQPQSTYTGLAAGNYTVYIKDNFGCIKTFSITNNGTANGNVTIPYTNISESNSLRFKECVDWGICGNYKNVFNTLSCEENTPVKPTLFTQLFQACDSNIKTQVRTSYQNVEVAAGNTAIAATKIAAYIGMQDKRDCTYYSYNNQLAVLFTTGNTYDYGTANVNGTYQLNGLLPDYGVIGTWVETAYGTLQVSNIRLDNNGQRSLIFNIATSIPVTAGTIQCVYNQESYDVWEFTIDMNAFLNTSFNVGVRFYQTTPDVNFPDVFWKSERIQVKTRWERSKEIIWRNSENTDIYFYSGIEMKNRLNFCEINTNLSDGDVEIEKTDSQVIPIDATNYNVLEFEANFLTTGMVRKIKLALKHDFLVIEGVPYALAENPETERIGKTNMYNLKAKVYEAGDVWNQGTANTQTIFTGVPLIGLLQGDQDAEYLRIQ